jgi:hypothetical protein
MPEYLDPTRYLGNQQNHQKMYDFERDILRVKNPLTTDFTFIYDMMPVVVPANGTKDMERYLVRRYVWNIIGHIYNQITEAKVEKATEAFQRTHPDVIDDPYLINEKIWLKLPRVDNPEFQRKIIADCVLGVVSKFGANRVVANAPKNGQLDPSTPLFEQLINDFKTVGVDEAASAPPASSTPNDPLPTGAATVEEATI